MSYKTVYKPWGKEVWLELNDKYCYKQIHINAGHKTSYQYHNYKLETNYIVEGTAEVWLENDEGVTEKKIMKAGEWFTVIPPRKHRVVAITDIILQETSTPEVDDVIRISDDTNRQDGRIEHEHMKPALCILAAGIGSRLANLSNHINKGLLPLENKAIISHLIDKTPADYDIVVVLGYKGDMVEDYCRVAHPDRNFTFVTVDRYEGEGTGPGYSIKQAEQHLQRPFIWATADVIITDDLPTSIDCNWLGLYPTSMPERYSTANIEGDDIVSFVDKSKDGYDYAFIGLAGVHDYKIFWAELDGPEIVSAYYNCNYPTLKGYKFEWYDIGTLESYLHAQKIFDDTVQYSIPKTNGEFLYKINDRFIKLCSDEKFISGRVNRAETLGDLTPEIIYNGNNLYAYNWKEGHTLYDCNNLNTWSRFLVFLEDNMWKPVDKDIREECLKFYKDKTLDRLQLFLSTRKSSYWGDHVINGVKNKSITAILNDFDWDSISDGLATEIFHGDLQFDNVITDIYEQFYLLDWRQDFAEQSVGDVYYDLAKLYGGILMSYKLMKDSNNFSCHVDGEVVITVTYAYSHEPKLDEFKHIYEQWIVNNNYDLRKVKTITSLIFLNMAPLHEKEFGDLLFFKSTEMMQNE